MNGSALTPGLRILAVGDVAADRDNPDECFDLVRTRIQQADVAFCQLETSLTARGSRLPQARHAVRGPPALANALKNAGFEIVSCAGNHCMDWGLEGFSDTLTNLDEVGIRVVGAGANIDAARQPVIVSRNSVRIAFLAYSSILPMSYWAETNRAGCAPMRAFTFYEQIEHDQPGTPARIHTFPHRDDLAALKRDVAAAKELADAVFVSLHWGIHFVPVAIADYQRDVAFAAIDAGADAILGHHAHILKGVEIYRGAPIFYSLCNFATDLRMDKAHAESKSFKEIQSLSPDWTPDFESLYNFPPASRMSMAVDLNVSKHGLECASILPIYIGRDARPDFLKSHDPRFAEVSNYLTDISEKAGFSTRFETAGEALIPIPA